MKKFIPLDIITLSIAHCCFRPSLRKSLDHQSRSSQPQVIPNQAMMVPPTVTNSNQWPNTSTSTPAANQPQWALELPHQRTEKPQGKFVPMQYRTQPANLPGSIKRQNSNMTNIEKGENIFFWLFYFALCLCVCFIYLHFFLYLSVAINGTY